MPCLRLALFARSLLGRQRLRPGNSRTGPRRWLVRSAKTTHVAIPGAGVQWRPERIGNAAILAFLGKVGDRRSIVKYRKDQTVFSQGEPADAVFYIQKGKVKITVISTQGKEAVVAILGPDDFFGEGCLAAQPRRIATVTTTMDSTIMRLEKAA